MDTLRKVRMGRAAVVVMAALVSISPVRAQQKPDDHAAHHADAAAAQALPLVDGEVRRIDMPAAKLTVRHAPIPNLDMPAMTMVFRVKTPDMLSKVKPGDKVKFSVERLDGALVITGIQAAN